MDADLHTLTGAYAADALDDLERAAFERHLATCPDCREEVRGLRETVVRLADGVAAPMPARARERVLAQIAVTPQVPRRVSASASRGGSRRPRTWLAAAAVVLAVAAGSGTVAWQQYGELQRDAEQARFVAARVAEVVGDPRATRVTGPLASGGTATLVVSGSNAVLLTSGVGGLPEDRNYQLWFVRPGSVTSAGLGPAGPDAGGSWARVVDGVRPGDTIALSVEPRGGSQQPTTTPVVALKA